MSEEEIINELRARWIPRDELAMMLGTTERQARSYTEELTQKLIPFGTCVLSTAAKKGYHIPDPANADDVALASTAIEELKSKAISIFNRRKAIEAFLTKANKPIEVQLSLFQ